MNCVSKPIFGYINYNLCTYTRNRISITMNIANVEINLASYKLWITLSSKIESNLNRQISNEIFK
jgi:hypothetical protein